MLSPSRLLQLPHPQMSTTAAALAAAYWWAAGPIEVLPGGPNPSSYDSPFLSLRVNGSVRGWTANAKTYLYSDGQDVNAFLPTPAFTGLGPDPSPDALDHCGAWLNAATVISDATLAGFYHEEWRCNYSDNFYTNKSIGYALSLDGGSTFTRPGHPDNVIIAAPIGNTTTVHQTGEGDHGVVRWSDWLLMFFTDWDGFHGAVTIATARSRIADGGVPGSWYKYDGDQGGWTQPGVGGSSSMLANITGTAVYAWMDWECNATSPTALVALGAKGLGSPSMAFSTDGLAWSRAPAPVVHVDPSSWARTGSPELYGYWALAGLGGADAGQIGNAVSSSNSNNSSSPLYAYATYWPAGSTARYLVRRQISVLGSACRPTAGTLAGSSWVEVSRYTNVATGDVWDTTGTVLPNSGYNRSHSTDSPRSSSSTSRLFVNTQFQSSSASTSSLLPVFECQCSSNSNNTITVHAPTMAGECGSANFLPGFVCSQDRTLGWVVAPAAPPIDPKGAACPGGGSFGPAQVFRCEGQDPASGRPIFTLDTGSCATGTTSQLLGAALLCN